MPQMKLTLARQPNVAQATKHKNLKILKFPKKHLGILEFPKKFQNSQINSRITLKFLIINFPKILQFARLVFLALFGTENNATELNTTNEIAFGVPTKWGAAAKHKNLKNLEFPKKHLEILEFPKKFQNSQAKIQNSQINSRIPQKGGLRGLAHFLVPRTKLASWAYIAKK